MQASIDRSEFMIAAVQVVHYVQRNGFWANRPTDIRTGTQMNPDMGRFAERANLIERKRGKKILSPTAVSLCQIDLRQREDGEYT
jgi:hypothetical protein